MSKKEIKKEVEEEKIYKKGTAIRFHSSCNYGGCEESEVRVLERDSTESELNDEATTFAMETVAPEGWFEEDEDDE